MIDCGHGGPGDDQVAVGDEVVLIGRQGDENISATEWADRLNTIGYEIVCGISPRVPRVVIDPGIEPGIDPASTRATGCEGDVS